MIGVKGYKKLNVNICKYSFKSQTTAVNKINSITSKTKLTQNGYETCKIE